MVYWILECSERGKVKLHFTSARVVRLLHPFPEAFRRVRASLFLFNLGAGAARFTPKQTSRTDRSPNFLQSGLRNFSSPRRPLNNLPWLFLLARLLELALIFISISDQSSCTPTHTVLPGRHHLRHRLQSAQPLLGVVLCWIW
jgi:hypothetical protein